MKTAIRLVLLMSLVSTGGIASAQNRPTTWGRLAPTTRIYTPPVEPAKETPPQKTRIVYGADQAAADASADETRPKADQYCRCLVESGARTMPEAVK